MLDNPDKYLLPNTSIKVSLDIDITYEEANYIKDNFVDNYKLRDITLVPVKTSEHTEDVGAEIRFETIDEIVIAQLTELDGSYDKQLLIEIYNNLAA